jgi:site-specific recombinase XerC
MERIWITGVELKRHKVLTDVLEGNIDLRAASELLGLSYRHTLLSKTIIMCGLFLCEYWRK